MKSNIIEKDALAFLGLMAIANKNFDQQFKHSDGETTHTKGLNIFAAIKLSISLILEQIQNNFS